MAALFVLQSAPYATLADELEPAVQSAQTESTEVPASEPIPEQTEAIASPAPASTPGLNVEDVEITYYAQAISGSVGSLGKEWVPLEGGTHNALKFPAISAGNWQIKITYAGDETHSDTEATGTVTLNEGGEAPFTLKETPGTVVLTVDENLNVDYDAVRKAIFNAVIKSSDVLTIDNVTITYHAPAAIYNAVVASTSPLALTADDVTVEYNVDKTCITAVTP